MLRILSECSASVRKSLQGLDYYAAEGTRTSDDLISLVSNINEVESDMDVSLTSRMRRRMTLGRGLGAPAWV